MIYQAFLHELLQSHSALQALLYLFQVHQEFSPEEQHRHRLTYQKGFLLSLYYQALLFQQEEYHRYQFLHSSSL